MHWRGCRQTDREVTFPLEDGIVSIPVPSFVVITGLVRFQITLPSAPSCRETIAFLANKLSSGSTKSSKKRNGKKGLATTRPREEYEGGVE